MKLYELNYLVAPDFAEMSLDSFYQEINSSIEKEGGILLETKRPIFQKLAYPIKKKNEGFLVSLTFNLSPEKLINIESKLKEKKQILRYLLTGKKTRVVQTRNIRPKKILKPSVRIEIKKQTKEKKVELADLDKKIDEILKE